MSASAAMAGSGSSLLPNVSPSRLDRLIAAVSPSLALRRYESRVRLESALRIFGPGGYAGARHDRQATKNWNPLLTGPNSATLPDLRMLRARTADLELNEPVGQAAVNRMATSVVGLGLRGHAQVNRDYLKLSDEAADELNRDIDFIINSHADSKAWDFEGRTDFGGQQDLALRAALGRGDAVVVRRFVERAGDVLATRFQLVEGDRLSTPDYLLDGPTLLSGVALDAANYPLGYWIQDQHPGDFRWMGPRTWTFVPARGAETGTWRVLHIYRASRAGQVRGVPMLAGVIEHLKQLSRLSEAELGAAVLNSMFAVFVKTQAGEVTLPDVLDGSPGQSVNPAPPVNDTRQLNLGPGATVIGLQPGEDIVSGDPKRPNVNFDPFFSAIVTQIGAAIDIPFEVLMMHFVSSFTAARAAFLEFWRAVMTRRRWLVRDYCAPAREALIEEAVARGLLDMPGFFTDPLARAAYCQARWTGPAMGQLNPVDETNAAAIRVEKGFTTIAEETSQMTGGDFESNHTQRAKEHRMRVDAGLEPEVLNMTTRAAIAETAPPEVAPAPRALPPVNPDDDEEGNRAA